MNEKTRIIIEVNRQPKYREICTTIARPDLADDLFQYLNEVLLMSKEDLIVRLWNENKLQYWLFSIAYRSYNSETGQFYWQFRRNKNYDPGIIKGEYDFNIDWKIEKVEQIISEYEKESEGAWFESEIFRLSVRFGSGVMVAQNTGIPYCTVKKTLRDFKKEIKKRYEDSLISR